jgi:hypothetical protein
MRVTRPSSLHQGERVLASLVANHVQGGRPIEGRLYLTSHRLMFLPLGAGVVVGGKSSSIPWSAVAESDVAERGWGEVSTRRRLRVTRVSGQVELFVVWRPAKAARLVGQARDTGAAGGTQVG